MSDVRRPTIPGTAAFPGVTTGTEAADISDDVRVLHSMGYAKMKIHAVGRILVLDLDAADGAAASRVAAEMCDRLLVNPNLETYELRIEPAS